MNLSEKCAGEKTRLSIHSVFVRAALTAALVLLCPGELGSVRAALSGSGTQQDPLRGNPEIAVGEMIAPEAWVRGLSSVHGRELKLRAIFEAGEYELLFHAAGGTIPGIGEKSLQHVRYNDGSGAVSDRIRTPENPEKRDYAFMGWYLKGNNSPDGTMIKNGSRFMIAMDDALDRSQAEAEGNAAVARAIWKKLTVTEAGDGNERDFPPDKQDPDDPWEQKHSRNQVIEYCQEAPTRQEYRRKYGQTAYQYGRILFDAETNEAYSYQWFLDGKQQAESSACFLFRSIQRRHHGSEVKCIVTLNDRKTTLEYKTEITVYHLPKLGETGFSYQRGV